MTWWEIGIFVGVVYISMFFTFQAVKSIVTYINEHRIVHIQYLRDKEWDKINKRFT